MSKNTLPVNGGAMPAPFLTNQQSGQLIRTPATVRRGAAVNVKPRSAANALLSKLMADAHARARADYADELASRGRVHHVNRPYSYYLALQMRSGFAEARVERSGIAPAFELPPQRWA